LLDPATAFSAVATHDECGKLPHLDLDQRGLRARTAILRAMLAPSIAAFDDTSICFHCAQPNRAASQWHAVFDGADRRFCCAGCLGIAQTIRAAGLDQFYRRRVAVGGSPNDAASADESERIADAAEAGRLVVHLDEHS